MSTAVGHPDECRCDACCDHALRQLQAILATLPTAPQRWVLGSPRSLMHGQGCNCEACFKPAYEAFMKNEQGPFWRLKRGSWGRG